MLKPHTNDAFKNVFLELGFWRVSGNPFFFQHCFILKQTTREYTGVTSPLHGPEAKHKRIYKIHFSPSHILVQLREFPKHHNLNWLNHEQVHRFHDGSTLYTQMRYKTIFVCIFHNVCYQCAVFKSHYPSRV